MPLKTEKLKTQNNPVDRFTNGGLTRRERLDIFWKVTDEDRAEILRHKRAFDKFVDASTPEPGHAGHVKDLAGTIDDYALLQLLLGLNNRTQALQETTDKSKTIIFKSVETYNATDGIPEKTISSGGKYPSGLPFSAQACGHCGSEYDKLGHVIYGAGCGKHTRCPECKDKGCKECSEEDEDENVQWKLEPGHEVESGNDEVSDEVASRDELGDEVVSSDELGDEVVSGDELGDEVVSGDEVGDGVGDEVGDGVGDGVDDEGDGEKVDGEDKPAEVSEETSIDKETTNLSKTKPKPPKAKFRVKDATRAKFGPDPEYTASIAVEAENGGVEEIVMAKNINGDWNWYNKTGLLEKLEMEGLKGGNPVEALTESLKKMNLGKDGKRRN